MDYIKIDLIDNSDDINGLLSVMPDATVIETQGFIEASEVVQFVSQIAPYTVPAIAGVIIAIIARGKKDTPSKNETPSQIFNISVNNININITNENKIENIEESIIDVISNG